MEAANQARRSEIFPYAWDVVTAAAAQADKRMSDKTGYQAGLHTQTVHDLLVPYAEAGVVPAELKRFYPYHKGEVYVNWGSRHAYQRDRNDQLFFAGIARRETVQQADLDDDVRGSFEQAITVQMAGDYVYDLSQGLADLIPSDDFPYRTMKQPDKVADFWNYIINGDNRRPGILSAAAFASIARDRLLAGLRPIYGEEAPQAAQYMLAVLYMRTSKRRSNETERELLTPLIESFNTRDVDLVRQTLTDFSQERFELVPEPTLRMLGLNETTLRQARDQQIQATRWTVSREAIEAEVYGNRAVGASRRFRSELDGNLNRWTDKNVGHIFVRGNMHLVLAGAVDKRLGAAAYGTEAPHMIFAWLDKTDPDNPQVRFSVLQARQVFKEMRGTKPKTIDAGEYAPVTEEIAYYLLTTEPSGKGNSYHHYDARNVLVNYLRRRREEAAGS